MAESASGLTSALTREEREYLRSLFEESAPQEASTTAEDYLTVELSGIDRAQLLQLLSTLQTELIATDGRHYFRLRVDICSNPYGGPRLRFSAPVAFDRVGKELLPSRTWPTSVGSSQRRSHGAPPDAQAPDISSAEGGRYLRRRPSGRK